MQTNSQFDYIIVGAGLSGLHLSYSLSRDEYFKDYSILIIDKKTSKKTDNYFSFWEIGKGKWDKILKNKWLKGNTVEDLNDNLKKLIKDSSFSLNFDECLNNKKIEDHILEDRIEGAKTYKVEATPTLIISGKKFEKALTYKNLKKYLEKLI